jgi:hypothetical protein
MKRSLVALLLVAGLVAGSGAAFADAVTVDLMGTYNAQSVQLLTYVLTGSTALDKDNNTIPDPGEMQMLQNVLANPSAPGHDVIHAAWTNNLNLLTGVSMPPPGR